MDEGYERINQQHAAEFTRQLAGATVRQVYMTFRGSRREIRVAFEDGRELVLLGDKLRDGPGGPETYSIKCDVVPAS